MSSLWLCLFFTYLFTTHAIEQTDDGDVFEEKRSSHLKDLGSFKLMNRILSSSLLENPSNKSEDNLQELFRSGSSAIKEIANATENSTTNFLKKFIQPMLSKPTPKRKRQTDLSNDQLNADENLPINRLLDATDMLFNQTAYIDKMLDKEENNSEKKYDHVYVGNRDLKQDHEFTPIHEENEPKARYSELLENIFRYPLKSDSKLRLNGSDQSVGQQMAQPRPKEIVKSTLFGISNGGKKRRPNAGPLVSAGILLIEKMKNVILNVVQKVQTDKDIGGKVFAVSALTSFVLSVGVSATKAFYTGYVVCERICRILTGKNGLVTCTLLDILAFPINIFKNSVLKISDLISIAKTFPITPSMFKEN